MNTKIGYLERKASGSETMSIQVVAGEIPYEDMERIFKKCLQDGSHFIPSKVGLPEKDWAELGYRPGAEPDYHFCELDGFDPTDNEPTVSMTAKELADRFKSFEGKDWMTFIFDQQESMADRTEELIRKMNTGLIQRLNGITDLEPQSRIKAAYEVSEYIQSHHYFAEEHIFKPEEIDALLAFADPLEVGVACLEANRSCDLDICDRIIAINAKETFPLADGTMPKQYIPEGLPAMCWSVLPGDGKLICVERGKSGYTPSDWETGDPQKNRETADYANRERGITKAQELAMVHGSMFSWDTLGADPNYYDQAKIEKLAGRNPKPQKKEKPSHGQSR